jgi:hypothetical protein
MAANPTDEALARLRADWPQWQIWVVTAWSAARSGVRGAGTAPARS